MMLIEETATRDPGVAGRDRARAAADPAYTAAVVGDDPGLVWQAARAARRAKPAESGRTWHQLMSEAALGSPALMAEQMQHLIAVSRLPTRALQVGIGLAGIGLAVALAVDA